METLALAAQTDYEYALFETARSLSAESGVPLETMVVSNEGSLIPNPDFADAAMLHEIAYERAHF